MDSRKIYDLPIPVIIMIVKMMWDEVGNTNNFEKKVLNKILKNFGFFSDHFLEHNFIYACLQLNEENLINNRLNKDNFIKPQLEEHHVTFVKTESRTYNEYYNYGGVKMFMVNEYQVSSLITYEGYVDSLPWWNRDADDDEFLDSDTIDTKVIIG